MEKKKTHWAINIFSHISSNTMHYESNDKKTTPTLKSTIEHNIQHVPRRSGAATAAVRAHRTNGSNLST